MLEIHLRSFGGELPPLGCHRQIEKEDFVLVVFATDFAGRDFQPIAKDGSGADFTAGIGHEELCRMNEEYGNPILFRAGLHDRVVRLWVRTFRRRDR